MLICPSRLLHLRDLPLLDRLLNVARFVILAGSTTWNGDLERCR